MAIKWSVNVVWMDVASETVFTAMSKFKKRVTLNKVTWQGKMLKSHPGLGSKADYVMKLKNAVEDPDYIVLGWFGRYLALRFCETTPKA
ncbi:MAG: hypothetical protein QXO32_02670 [Candidatus Bathyarchaeia archaeon]